MNIPAKYRTVVYWMVAVVSAASVIGTMFGLIPKEAVNDGLQTGAEIVAFLSAILALRNIKPDE
jgi:uncharacterized membrane-anchored protein